MYYFYVSKFLISTETVYTYGSTDGEASVIYCNGSGGGQGSTETRQVGEGTKVRSLDEEKVINNRNGEDLEDLEVYSL